VILEISDYFFRKKSKEETLSMFLIHRHARSKRHFLYYVAAFQKDEINSSIPVLDQFEVAFSIFLKYEMRD